MPTTLLPALSAVTLVALIWKLVDFAKALVNLNVDNNKNTVVTQALVWGVAVGVLVLAAHARITTGLELLPGAPLGLMDWPSQVLIALGFGSAGSVLFDFKKARDNTDSAATSSLIGPSAP